MTTYLRYSLARQAVVVDGKLLQDLASAVMTGISDAHEIREDWW